MSCHVRVGPIEKAELPASGVMDGKSVSEFDDPPRPRKAAGHVEILRGRKPRRTDDAETEGRIPKERTMARRLGGWGGRIRTSAFRKSIYLNYRTNLRRFRKWAIRDSLRSYERRNIRAALAPRPEAASHGA